jgi:hypothetical protein
MSTGDRMLAALEPVVQALEQLRVPYALSGSVASTAYGVPRTTLDVDLVAALKPGHVAPLCLAVSPAYYVAVEAVRSAVDRAASFNLIHLPTMVKVDVFVLGTDPYAREAFGRRRKEPLTGGGTPYFLPAPEDVILRKLEWYRKGGEVSERQWADVLGVLRVSGSLLEGAYLDRWARDLGVLDLLDRARREAGPS